MKKTTAFLIITLFVAFFGGSTAGVLWAQRGGKGMKAVQAGVVPTEFGDLVAAGGDANSTTLVFRKKNNELGIVKMRGNRVPPQIMVIKREY